jgi:carbamoyl-phosphate synthase small subunit
VHVLRGTVTGQGLLSLNPDGVFFSNGPGDPATADHAVELLREVLARRIPYFGICFGNQVFARALGLATYKLTYGHRGLNQPVLDCLTGSVEVTAHNHGFAVAWTGDARPYEPVPTPYGLAEVTHVCLNDDVIEGLRLVDAPAFSVQYHPEAAAGPHDATHLFDRFAGLMANTPGPPDRGY